MNVPARRRVFDYWRISAATSSPNLFLDVLLGLGIEVGHIKHPANFDHFVILSRDARGPFDASSRDFTWMIQ